MSKTWGGGEVIKRLHWIIGGRGGGGGLKGPKKDYVIFERSLKSIKHREGEGVLEKFYFIHLCNVQDQIKRTTGGFNPTKSKILSSMENSCGNRPLKDLGVAVTRSGKIDAPWAVSSDPFH